MNAVAGGRFQTTRSVSGAYDELGFAGGRAIEPSATAASSASSSQRQDWQAVQAPEARRTASSSRTPCSAIARRTRFWVTPVQ